MHFLVQVCACQKEMEPKHAGKNFCKRYFSVLAEPNNPESQMQADNRTDLVDSPYISWEFALRTSKETVDSSFQKHGCPRFKKNKLKKNE